MFWLLCGYLFLFIERPWEIWPVFEGIRIERLYMLFVLVVFLVWPDKKLVWHNTTTWILGFLAMHYILAPFAYKPEYATEQGFEYFKMVVFYLLIVMTIKDNSELRNFIFAFVVIVGLYLTHSFREYLSGRHAYRMGIERMIGVDQAFSDPNTFAATIVLSFPFVMALFITERNNYFKIGYIAFFILGLTCLVLTGSRSGFVAFILLLLLYLFTRRGWKKIAYIFVALLLLGVTWQLMPLDKKDRIMTIVDPERGPEDAQESAEGRIAGMKAGFRMFIANPVTGVGAGGKNFVEYRIRYDDGVQLQAHNLAGELFSEMGLLGAIFFIGLVVSTIKNAIIVMKFINNPYIDKFLPELGKALLICVILLLFTGIFGHNMYRPTWLWVAAWSALASEFLKLNYVVNKSRFLILKKKLKLGK